VVNPTRKAQKVSVRLDEKIGKFARASDLWQEGASPQTTGSAVEVAVEDRNVAVLRLEN
jgi:hypothetical protein